MNIEALEREHGARVVDHLSQALHMPAIGLEEMAAEEAAFDLVPYAEATRRGCVALRNSDGDIAIVLGDPFDLDTQDWLEERLGVPFRYRLAHRQDIAAFLSQQEEKMRALDGVKESMASGAAANDGAQVVERQRRHEERLREFCDFLRDQLMFPSSSKIRK